MGQGRRRGVTCRPWCCGISRRRFFAPSCAQLLSDAGQQRLDPGQPGGVVGLGVGDPHDRHLVALHGVANVTGNGTQHKKQEFTLE